MSKIEFTLGNERLIPTAGIAAVGAILGNAGFTSFFNKADVTEFLCDCFRRVKKIVLFFREWDPEMLPDRQKSVTLL